ncbi:uncharacterized protein [Excalfactoria chinensis]|uniref:uncharacterized protein n=1 Tax=Excalfactoria chinensis TaxID=46218 RepID=UPI003B39FFF8
MDAVWGSALLLAALLLTATLCIRCHRQRGPGAPLDTNRDKPMPEQPQSSFQIIPAVRYPSHVPPHPHGAAPELIPIPNPNQNLNPNPSWLTRGHGDAGSPQLCHQPRISTSRTEPDRAPPTCGPESEDDYSNEVYASGYVKVIPDPEDSAQTQHGNDQHNNATPPEPYENVPDVSRHSLGDSLEYINIPTATSSPASRYGSDRESDADGPDYENVYGAHCCPISDSSAP